MIEGRRPPATPAPPAHAVWDAGGLACGDLILQLRGRIEAMSPRQVLRLVALDAGAPEDLPAWCRLTGHTLLAADPPVYLIQRKER
jgi:tRNA 2-thiouridine synthesizing protein A